MQLGAETSATANEEKKNKEVSSAATRGSDILCPTALRNVASGGTRRKWARRSNSSFGEIRPTHSTVPGHLGLLRHTEDRTNTCLYRTCVCVDT